MSIFDDRKKKSLTPGWGEEEPKQTGKSGVYYTSQMQGILAAKDANEDKAATLLSEYLRSLASTTSSSVKLQQAVGNMLNGFTAEEQNRILAKALVRALCDI